MIVAPHELPAIEELLRMPSPAPAPQALAADGGRLWLGSWETSRLYGLDSRQGTVFEEMQAPGKPVGAVVTGDEVRLVISEHDDARYIYKYVPGHGFKTSEKVVCPDETGSFLAFDGERLWLSQRYNKRVLELDASYQVVREIPVGHEILGITFAGTQLWLSTWLGARAGGCCIATLDPASDEPQPRLVAQVPFAGVSLSYEDDRLWTSDFKHDALVAFAIPG